MRVLITGVSGFVGRAVTVDFIINNLIVTTVGREDFFKSQNIDFLRFAISVSTLIGLQCFMGLMSLSIGGSRSSNERSRSKSFFSQLIMKLL
jgi:hypothetical protein